MVELVTLDQAKAQLYVTDTAHDADIESKLQLASAIVLGYLKMPAVPADWFSGSPQVVTAPGEVQAATLLVLAELYMNRESSVTDVLSEAVKSLLHRHRDPALA